MIGPRRVNVFSRTPRRVRPKCLTLPERGGGNDNGNGTRGWDARARLAPVPPLAAASPAPTFLPLPHPTTRRPTPKCVFTPICLTGSFHQSLRYPPPIGALLDVTTHKRVSSPRPPSIRHHRRQPRDECGPYERTELPGLSEERVRVKMRAGR